MHKGVGITGVREHVEVGIPFLIGFCIMVKKDVFNGVGLLDEQFGIGGMEDVDLCERARRAGWGTRKVDGINIQHIPETTVHHLPQGRQFWEDHFRKNQERLAKKWKKWRVTVDICTRNRYDTTLAMCLQAVAVQTLRPTEVILYDDSDKRTDMREHPVLRPVLALFQEKGISWRVIFGAGQGQVEGHRTALREAKGDFIWRLDDDNVPEPDVLEKLMSNFDDRVGAVGGLVLEPQKIGTSSLASNKMEDIYLGLNVQWFRQDRKRDVDHLYSTFVYRKGKDYYPNGLSRVGHREETIMTYRMRRDGWRLIVDPSAVTWHYRSSTGGIRDGQHSMWSHDEQIFSQLLIDWGVKTKRYKCITLDNGIGDHYAFRKALPEILSCNPDIILAVCYPSIFDSMGVRLVSIGEARMAGWGDNIYRFMIENNWKGSLVDAFKKYYS